MFCLETERSISNDWVVRYENRYFQMERSRLSAAAGEGEGVRVGRRANRDSVSGKGAAASGDRSAPGEAIRSHPGGGEATGSSIPVETAGEPPVAQGGARGGDAAGHYLRYALNALPSGLARLRSGSGPPHGRNWSHKEEGKRRLRGKGDTFNELRKGTF